MMTVRDGVHVELVMARGGMCRASKTPTSAHDDLYGEHRTCAKRTGSVELGCGRAGGATWHLRHH